MIYAEEYPFIDRLWCAWGGCAALCSASTISRAHAFPPPSRPADGEGFDYNSATPDYWLVEMSGLVFGLTADMLRYPGMTPFHFRGMLYGESNRWQGDMDPGSVETDPFCPVALWKLWQSVGIASATLYGFWLEEALGAAALPVATNASAAVKTTTYALPDTALVVVGSFAPTTVAVSLSFNNSILKLAGGLDAFCLYAPPLPPFQAAAKLALNESFLVPQGQGWIFLVQPC